MALIVTGNNSENYEICPDELMQAVCYAVVDLGYHYDQMYDKTHHKVAVLFEMAKTMSEGDYTGKRFVLSKIYTLTLGKKANLRKDLESWRGRQFTEEELLGFDLEKLVGVNAMINVIHVIKGEKTFANISAIMKQQTGSEKMVPENKELPKWIIEMQEKGMANAPKKETKNAVDTPSNNGELKKIEFTGCKILSINVGIVEFLSGGKKYTASAKNDMIKSLQDYNKKDTMTLTIETDGVNYNEIIDVLPF